MKANELLRHIGIATDSETEITSICNDSRRVKEGSLFISMSGRGSTDYGAYIEDAERRGAAAVVTEELRETASSLPQFPVPDAGEAYAILSAAFFGFPAKDLTLIGVTGTNGKTSSAYFTKAILEHAGVKTGLIGTVETLAGDEVISTGLTTPEAFELHAIFKKMRDKGITHVVMECSSQALAQKRLFGLSYETVGFTNLTQDHLDYHGNFDAYREAKGIVFGQTKRGILNRDDAEYPYFSSLVNESESYSVTDAAADFFASDVVYGAHGCRFTLCYRGETYPVSVSTPGRFAVSNALCAIAMAVSAGVDVKTACEGMSEAPGVKGRAEVCFQNDRFTVLIDYAHTPDAIMNILKAVESKGRKVVLFGCGGDRDSTKRPLMASMAARYADKLIVTSDNPRTEDPMKIIDDILLGLHNVDVPYVTIPDRKEAIAHALSTAEPNDTIFLLGKGHEDYQILSTGKIHFDEREIVKELIGELRL